MFSLFGFGESVRKLHSFFMWLIISSITSKYVIAATNLCIYISDHVCVWPGPSCCKIFRQWSKDPSFIQLDESKKRFFLLAYTYSWDHYTEDCRSVLIQIAAYPGSLVLQHKIFRWAPTSICNFLYLSIWLWCTISQEPYIVAFSAHA